MQRRDDVLHWLVWTLTVLALLAIALLKGCCFATAECHPCETMLAECERGLEEMARMLDDAGHPD